VAVVGWDDVPAAAYADVPLTTLAHPAEEQGVRLAELFLEGLEDPRRIAGSERRLPLPLFVRSSCGAPGGPPAATSPSIRCGTT
jgi:DNA-binding LacI/PurR family transcriptional regulator